MKSLPRPLARPNRLVRQRKAHLKSIVRDLKKIAHQEIERTAELLQDNDNPIVKEYEGEESAVITDYPKEDWEYPTDP